MKKRTIKNLISTVVISLGVSSCNVLDLNDTSSLSDLAVWNSEISADMYVTASYKTFTDISQVANSRSAFYDSYSDLTKSTSWDQYTHTYNKALLQASSFTSGGAGAFECWNDVYVRIRRANVLLDDIKRYGIPKFGQEWCDIRSAEARLCRAFSYYRLIRVYGGVIIRTESSGTNGVDDGYYESDIHRKRATEAESWDFVIKELQWAGEHLPAIWGTETAPKQGRATKKTAYGLLSRIALFAGQWQIAADAATKVKELGGALATDYAKVFQVNENPEGRSNELLFVLYYQDGSVTHNYDLYNRPFGDITTHGNAYAEHVPTAELADLYEFKDGTPFDWATYKANGHADPYTEREPRFQATILYNGCTWEGRKIQSYIGGSDGFVAFTQSGSTNAHTCTGYYLRKYLQEGYGDYITKRSFQYDAVLRYAEVLLNKAEAYAQLNYDQYKTDALDALNEVRNRVGLPDKTIADAPDKDSFMKLLRKERCVELAGEGFRYWDLRRWELAESMINGQNAHGVKITKNTDNTFTYEKVACDGGTPRIFLEKFYYFSLPTSETANNDLCENNPYW